MLRRTDNTESPAILYFKAKINGETDLIELKKNAMEDVLKRFPEANNGGYSINYYRRAPKDTSNVDLYFLRLKTNYNCALLFDNQIHKYENAAIEEVKAMMAAEKSEPMTPPMGPVNN